MGSGSVAEQKYSFAAKGQSDSVRSRPKVPSARRGRIRSSFLRLVAVDPQFFH